MKPCSYCGHTNTDKTAICVQCGESLQGTPMTQSAMVTTFQFTPEEERFWKQMNFLQFMIIFFRIQALWFFFNGAITLTYLPSYLRSFLRSVPDSPSYEAASHGLLLFFIRLAIHVTLGILLITKPEMILRWFVKDLVPKLPQAITPPSARE